MLREAILLCLVAVATARTSPHADLVRKMVAEQGPGRFSDNIVQDALLDVPELVRKYGYPLQVHRVLTSDGYILEMHRIPHGRDQNNQPGDKPVVFLMHGLLCSSADYVVLGPGNALAYLLAEAGFDVWMGNARGNYYSRNHITLSPDDKENVDFWKFSWDETGNYDLPAFIDYILFNTGRSKLHYIGHSQGGTNFLVLTSLRPEYNAKIASYQGLAPASFVIHGGTVFVELVKYMNIVEEIAYSRGIAEMFGKSDQLANFALSYCTDRSPIQPICTMIIDQVTNGKANENYNVTMIPVFVGHAPAGASLRQFVHFSQGMVSHAFRRYDYGPITNFRVYGSFQAPDYDLSRITVPSYLYYGLEDHMTDPRDLKVLADNYSPALVDVIQVPKETFNHYEFIWGIDVKDVLYNQLIETVKRHDN